MKSERASALSNISPILADDPKWNKLAGQCSENFISSQNDEVLRQNTTNNKSSHAVNHLGILNLRDEERRSLTNFEEFENTLSLLENNRDEKELDDLLNSFNTNHSPINDKVRQSLDSIKKRHSLINLEKQHQDELKRMDGSMNRSSNGDATVITADRQRMNDSLNKLMMSSSGSGERLLRRSRLYEDTTLSIAPGVNTDGATHVIKSAVLNDTVSHLPPHPQSQSHSTPDDYQLNGTMSSSPVTNQVNETYHARNTTYPYPLNETQKTETASPPFSDVDTDKSNRDRFKTIRIFKRPPENARMVPELNDNNSHIHDNIPAETKFESVISNEHFSTKNTNSPNSARDSSELTTNRKATGVVALKKSALTRPKYLSGIAKRDPTARSSSQEILGSNTDTQRSPQGKPVSALKSPMGIKAKSIHNLAGNAASNKYSYSNDIQVGSTIAGIFLRNNIQVLKFC